MKIAEGLTESKRLANLVPTLMSLFGENCIIINGIKPERDPTTLMEKVQGAIDTKATLDRSIANTNAIVKLPCGLTIYEAILRKAELNRIVQSFTHMHSALRSGRRQSYNETAVKTYGVKPEILEARSNEAAKELRLIEAQLQQTNWVEDLR